mmetsp:Transcript_20530/g.46522  ORF Transcript_20530/g.46522 Transcript_20530/m.46522 type:complete len:81 (+) Transcript_20530:65-307(+)
MSELAASWQQCARLHDRGDGDKIRPAAGPTAGSCNSRGGNTRGVSTGADGPGSTRRTLSTLNLGAAGFCRGSAISKLLIL